MGLILVQLKRKNMMKSQTACFTGHRKIPVSEYKTIQKRLESEMINLIHQDVSVFMAGLILSVLS